MEQLLWPDVESGPIPVLISSEFPRNPCEVVTSIFSILQVGKLRLREVKILLKQAATDPYSASVWVTKTPLPWWTKYLGRHRPWQADYWLGASLHCSLMGGLMQGKT